jgi:leader peptidase (prepilin peptidase)/N-methyltransferase
MTPALTAYVLVLVALLGACMGSFLDCLAWRLVHGGNVFSGRSKCDACDHVLGIRDLIPIVSWVSTKGHCRYCGAHISCRHPLIELLCAGIFVVVMVRYQYSLEAIEMIAFACILIVLSLTDLDSWTIPNGCIVTAIVIRFAYVIANGVICGMDVFQVVCSTLFDGLIVAIPLLVLVLFADKVLKKESMGGGDLKLFFVAGLYFGWQECLLLIILACVFGIVLALCSRPHNATDASHQAVQSSDDPEDTENDHSASDQSATGLQRMIPFGPSIALACFATMLCGQTFIAWYIGLF